MEKNFACDSCDERCFLASAAVSRWTTDSALMLLLGLFASPITGAIGFIGFW